MPGFSAEEIEVGAEPRRFIISARTRTTDAAEAVNTLHKEILARGAFRLLDLSAEIEADELEATLTAGILKNTLPKLFVGNRFNAQATVS